MQVVPPRDTRDFSVGGTHSDRELVATFGDRGTGRDLRAELARQPADLVLVDALTFGALDAARASGVRYAVLEHFFDEYYQRLLAGHWGSCCAPRAFGRGVPCVTPQCAIVTSLPELDPSERGSTVRQVGPSSAGGRGSRPSRPSW